MSKGSLYIEVTGDFNDGDYVTEKTCVDHLSHNEIKDVFETLTSWKGPNVYENLENTWDFKMGEECVEMTPSMDNMDLHTIEQVNLLEIKYLNIEDLN